MNSVRVLGILVALLLVIILGQKYFLNPTSQKQQKAVSSTPTPTISKSPTPTVFNENQNQPSNSPTPVANQNQNNSEQNEDLIYPGSIKTKDSVGSLELESSDDTQLITDWYKEKIKGMGMNAKSFVQTKANEKILNKLVGSNGKTEIRVEISKENNLSTTKISVVIIDL
ncbi:MAG: hypothetical protein M1524_00205 [Patescibacteria group bacterium]|nr:hypothetical protein [Patescibacteria group bacterium]